MLLEAWRIAEALRDAGIEVAARCADVKSPGKTGGPLLRILIGEDLSTTIVPVSDDELTSLWTFRKGNFHFWPIVRPSAPLCVDQSAALQWRSKLKQASALRGRSAREAATRSTLADGVQSITCQLGHLAQDESSALAKHQGKFLQGIRLPPDIQLLRDRINRYLQRTPTLASTSIGDQRAIFAILFGKEANGKVVGDGQIAFDLKERSIYSQASRQAVEAALSNNSEAAIGHHPCQLTGLPGTQHKGKFPSPTLPVVANSGISMFSMFRDAPANFRYGRADDGIVSLNIETVSAAHDSLAYVTAEHNRGLYWRPFPNGRIKERKEQKDLLIAYAHGVQAAPIFDTGEDEEPDGPTYDEAIRPILAALDGRAKLKPRAGVLLVLLRQISNAQVQAVYCNTPLAAEVLKAGKRWIEAQAERPALLCSSSKGQFISPAQVVRLLSKQWVGAPPKPRRLSGPSSSDALNFMLASGPDRAVRASDLLRQLLQRSSSLLVYVGAESRLHPEKTHSNEDNRRGPRVEADQICSLLSLILNAKDRTLEDTTRSPAYLLGLLLGLVDTLHWAYCSKVRKAIPSSLGGSQLLGIASDDPQRALCDLLERIRPWHDWADTAQPDKDDNTTLRAKKALTRLAKVAPQLSGRLPSRLDETGKGELLLGFLSRDAVADDYTVPQ